MDINLIFFKAKKLYSVCKKTLCQIRKRKVRGLRSQKKLGVRQLADEHFSDKRNEEIGVFLLTLFRWRFQIIIVSLFVIIFAAISLPAQALPKFSNYQDLDSLKNAKDSLDQLVDFNSKYLENAEIDHQKLLRNIFAVSFFFMMGLLVFTMLFYGSKIKKISNIIILQDDALKSTKDQLIKIISIFNYIDQQVYITDSKGIVEWVNAYSLSFFNEKYEDNKISLVEKFSIENQGIIFKAINDQQQVFFKDSLFKKDLSWKMIPVKNSKGEFSNMVFIC
jgi:hypothetical protein